MSTSSTVQHFCFCGALCLPLERLWIQLDHSCFSRTAGPSVFALISGPIQVTGSELSCFVSAKG